MGGDEEVTLEIQDVQIGVAITLEIQDVQLGVGNGLRQEE